MIFQNNGIFCADVEWGNCSLHKLLRVVPQNSVRCKYNDEAHFMHVNPEFREGSGWNASLSFGSSTVNYDVHIAPFLMWNSSEVARNHACVLPTIPGLELGVYTPDWTLPRKADMKWKVLTKSLVSLDKNIAVQSVFVPMKN